MRMRDLFRTIWTESTERHRCGRNWRAEIIRSISMRMISVHRMLPSWTILTMSILLRSPPFLIWNWQSRSWSSLDSGMHRMIWKDTAWSKKSILMNYGNLIRKVRIPRRLLRIIRLSRRIWQPRVLWWMRQETVSSSSIWTGPTHLLSMTRMPMSSVWNRDLIVRAWKLPLHWQRIISRHWKTVVPMITPLWS